MTFARRYAGFILGVLLAVSPVFAWALAPVIRDVVIFGGQCAGQTGSQAMLCGEPQGMALDFSGNGGLGSATVIDTTTAANNLTNASVDSFLTQSGTSPKLVLWNDGLYRWTRHNLFINSSTPATQNVTLITGATYTYGVTGTGSLAGSSGASGTATDGAPVTFVATGTTGTFTKTGTLSTMWINRGAVQSTPYHATGAAAWFGVPIEYNAGFYALIEPAATNRALYASDLTQAGSWTLSNVTAALTATGPDGVANSASTLTATAGNGTALQAITSASAARITSVFLKRRTGTGNVDLTQDNGATWTTQTLTSSWARYSLAAVTSADPTVGVRLVTSGDEVDVAWFKHELGSIDSSPIPTFAATVTRGGDIVTVATSAFPYNSATETIIASWWPRAVNGAAIVILASNSTNRIEVLQGTATQLETILAPAGFDTVHAPTALNAKNKAAAAYAVNDFAVSVNGAAAATAGAFAMPAAATIMKIGARFFDTTQLNGRIYSLVYVPRRMTNAEIKAKTQ